MVRRGKPRPQPSSRSALVWALLSLLMASAGAATGYLAGQTAGDTPAEPLPPPKLLQIDDIFAAGLTEGRRSVQRARVHQRRAGYRAGEATGRKLTRAAVSARYRPGGPAHRRIFLAGAQAGDRQALARFHFGGGGFYIVDVADGGRRVSSSHGPLSRSEEYVVCRDRHAVCVRKVGR